MTTASRTRNSVLRRWFMISPSLRALAATEWTSELILGAEHAFVFPPYADRGKKTIRGSRSRVRVLLCSPTGGGCRRTDFQSVLCRRTDWKSVLRRSSEFHTRIRMSQDVLGGPL